MKKKIKNKEEKNNLSNTIESANEGATEEKERILAIINNLTDGLIILDEDKKVIKVNPQIENIFSLKAAEIENKNINDLKGSLAFSQLLNIILIKNELKEVSGQQFSPREDATIELTSRPIVIDKKRDGYLLIFHDISRQKLVEKLKTEFITLAAHQLRTPLSGIKWNLKMLIDGSFGELKEEQKEFLEVAYKNNERMIRLVDDLLDVTKIEEGRHLYYVKKEDIVKIAGEVVDSLAERIKQKNLKFTFIKPESKIPKLDLDREKIAICIQNFLINSINYTNSGGEVTITIEYDKKKKEVLLGVKDTGFGIPKDQQKRIFTKFYRSTPAMKAEPAGSGVGLYITKNIIEAHKGKVGFESEEGKGSTFFFTLPVV